MILPTPPIPTLLRSFGKLLDRSDAIRLPVLDYETQMDPKPSLALAPLITPYAIIALLGMLLANSMKT